VDIRAPCVMPVPESGMLRLASDPVEVMLRFPLAAPLVAGLKRTVKGVLWPGFKVKGNANPLRLNPAPLVEAAEIVRLVPPEFVRLPLIDLDVLIWMGPKPRLEGLDPNCPTAAPVPERAIGRVALLAFE